MTRFKCRKQTTSIYCKLHTSQANPSNSKRNYELCSSNPKKRREREREEYQDLSFSESSTANVKSHILRIEHPPKNV